MDKTTKLLQTFVKSFERLGSHSEVSGEVFEIIFSVTKETLLFREVQDLLDELGMLSALFKDQLDVLRDVERILYPDKTTPAEAGTSMLGLSQSRVKKHLRDVARMEEQARQAYEMVEHPSPACLKKEFINNSVFS